MRRLGGLVEPWARSSGGRLTSHNDALSLQIRGCHCVLKSRNWFSSMLSSFSSAVAATVSDLPSTSHPSPRRDAPRAIEPVQLLQRGRFPELWYEEGGGWEKTRDIFRPGNPPFHA